MVTLPLVQSQDQGLMLLQTRWKSVLDQSLLVPILNGHILSSVALQTGNNTFNHLLGRKMQGWIIIDKDGIAVVYRTGTFNDTNLTLNASQPVTVSLWVF